MIIESDDKILTLKNATFKPQIYFEDQHLVVLSKPAGLLSQSDISQTPSLVDWLRLHFNRHYVGLIHRLDRNTSGLMVIAKRTKSAQRLTQSLQEGTLTRSYISILKGRVEKKIKWTHWLRKNKKTNKSTIFSKKTKDAQICSLTCTPVKYLTTPEGECTLCEIQLETGRSHQIRAQCAFEKHPLLGDSKYGKKSTLIHRPALHSNKISFPHPMTKEILIYKEEPPVDFNL